MPSWQAFHPNHSTLWRSVKLTMSPRLIMAQFRVYLEVTEFPFGSCGQHLQQSILLEPF